MEPPLKLMLPKRELAFSVIVSSFHVFFVNYIIKEPFLIESIHHEGAI